MTVVTGGAKVPVVAGCGVQQMGTPELRVAHIISTEILIVTSQRSTASANTTHARLTDCTAIAVVTGPLIRLKYATRFASATVIGTGIPVLANKRDSSQTTFPRVTGFDSIAEVPIIAYEQLPWLAAGGLITAFNSVASIAVITVDGRARSTLASGADIP